MIDIAKACEEFDDFLVVMDDQLDRLEDKASGHGVQLDLTMNSLENLESLFFTLADNADEDRRESLIVTFARHVGEIVRISYGGQWKLSLDDPRNVYYSLPVIAGHTAMLDLEFSPIDAMHAVWLRRRPGLLRQIIMADIEPVDLDIDHLVEE